MSIFDEGRDECGRRWCTAHRKSSNNSFRSGKNNLGSKIASNASAALNKNESPSNSKTSHTCAQVLTSK
jgi:hypothetical protein